MKTGHLKSLAKPVPVCTVAHVLKKKSGYGLGKHKRNCQNKKKKWGEKYIGFYTKHEGIPFMIWAAIWGGGCTGESTEWTGIRDRPKEGILQASI